MAQFIVTIDQTIQGCRSGSGMLTPPLKAKLSTSFNFCLMKESVTALATLESMKIERFSDTELCDVIGTIVSISDAILFNNFSVDKIRRTVILEDVEGSKLECCFFYSWSEKFAKLHNERDSMKKPSMSNAMYSTKLCINDDILEIAAFKQSVGN
ncbi:hypothetical protein Tco_0337213 [Tanacetum coccineum]